MIINLWSITLAIDHKPLLGLFGDFKPIAHMAYLVEYIIMGLAYRFDLDEHSWSGENLGTADALSRLPLSVATDSTPKLSEWTMLVNFLD